MNFKRIFVSFLLVLTMLSSVLHCSAGQNVLDFDLSIDNDTGIVTVSGTIDSKLDKTITMAAYYPAATGEVTASNIKSMIYAIDETEADANGNFSFTFTITDAAPAGEYLVSIGVEDLVFTQAEREGKVNFVNSTQRQTIVNEFNKPAPNMGTLFQTYSSIFNLPANYAGNETAVHANILQYRTQAYNGRFTAFSEVQKAALVGCAAIGLSTLKESGFDLFLANNEDLLSVDLENGDYVAHKAQIQSALWRQMTGKEPIAAWITLEDNFQDTIILTAFNNADRTEIDGLLKRYDTELGINVTGDYETLDPIEVAKVLVGQDFTDVSQITTKFNNRVSTLLSEENGSDNSGGNIGGGGGGGGRGGRGGDTIFVDLPYKNDDVASLPFEDIKNVTWAHEAIIKLTDRGIISGMTKTEFCPDASITREQFVKMIVMAFGQNWTSGDVSFFDAVPGTWYYASLKKAVGAGIITGQTATSFGVGKSIARQDVAVILHRIMKDKLTANGEPAFKDWDSVSAYATEAVAAMQSAGIISGDENGFFNPGAVCTRAQAAKLIYSALTIMEKGE